MSDQPPEALRSIVDELLTIGAIDFVPLHDVVWLSTEGDRSATAKERTSGILRHLFTTNDMVPGNLGDTGLEDWLGGPDDWEQRASADLERLDWNPMGHGFWLRLVR